MSTEVLTHDLGRQPTVMGTKGWKDASDSDLLVVGGHVARVIERIDNLQPVTFVMDLGMDFGTVNISSISETEVSETEVQELDLLYSFRGRAEIIRFLESYPSLVALLLEARCKIQEYFPDSNTYLEIFRSRESADDDQLVIYIATKMDPDDVLDSLDRLDEDWWLSALDRAQGKLGINPVLMQEGNIISDSDIVTFIFDQAEAMIGTLPPKQSQISPLEAVQTFAEFLTSNEEVEAILANADPDGLRLFVVVNNIPFGCRDDIHEGEWKLMELYPESGFDFRVIDRRGRLLRDVISVELFDVYLRISGVSNAY